MEELGPIPTPPPHTLSGILGFTFQAKKKKRTSKTDSPEKGLVCVFSLDFSLGLRISDVPRCRMYSCSGIQKGLLAVERK